MPTVVVWHTGQLGDTIVAVPVIRAVRDAFPRARLVLLADSSREDGGSMAVDVLKSFGIFDEFITYHPLKLRTRQGRRKFAAALRDLGPCAVVYLARWERSRLSILRDWLFLRWTGIRRLYGFSFRRSFLWKRAALRRRCPSQVDWLVENLRRDGLPVSGTPRFDLPISAADIEAADNLYREWGLQDFDGPVVAVCPGSRMPAKRWPEDRYAELGKRLRERPGCALLLVGGEEDRPLAERLAGDWGGGAIACGRTGYMASAELLRRADLYVGNDTGAMHLAAAVGTPCVALFSARAAPTVWEPYGEGHVVLRKRVPCEFCGLTECTQPGHPCLAGIEVEEVTAACLSVLEQRSST